MRFSSGEDDPVPTRKSRSSKRFENHLTDKDDRMKDVMMHYRENDVIKRNRLDKIRHDYSQQRHVLSDEKEDVKKQSNITTFLPKHTVSATFFIH